MFKQYVTLPSGRLRPFLATHRDAPKKQLPAGRKTFLTPVEAADLLRVSPVTMCRWRIEGQGPHFAKFGRTVRYDHDEILAWARSRSRRSTSET